MPYPFIQARNYTPTSGRTIDVLVVHSMEAPERLDTAERVAHWFAGPNAPRASIHYLVDSNSVVQAVRDEDVAWHAPGANHDSIGIEHAGYASQTPRDWSDPYSTAMLALSAQLAAEKCRQYRIPAIWLYAADLRAGRRGITSHANVSRAFHRSDHTDPGPGFPIERYVRTVRRLLGPPANEPPLKDPPPTLRQGASGWRVKRLQKLLRVHGFDPGPADGIFGPLTAAAVRELQHAKDLEPDGIVGPLTWRALKSDL